MLCSTGAAQGANRGGGSRSPGAWPGASTLLVPLDRVPWNGQPREASQAHSLTLSVESQGQSEVKRC